MEPWRQVQSTDAFQTGRYYGVYPALVTNNKDPENRGRVKVKFPWLHQTEESWWARVATFYAGKGRGSYLMPELDDEVLVTFEHGDFHFPYVVGSVWNGVDNVPGPGNPDGKNDVKHFQSRSGHKLVFEDTGGAEKITLVDCSGKNSVVIDVAADTITATAQTGDIYIKAPAGKIDIDCKNLNVSATLDASYDVSNDQVLQTKTQAITVGATQLMNVKTKLVHSTPTMVANVAGALVVQSSTTKMTSDALQAELGAVTFTEGKVTRKVKECGAELGAYTLTTPTMKLDGDKIGLSAGAAFAVTAGKISLDGSQACLVGGATVVVMGGMVVFKGSSVMVHGSV